ncbi:MAG: AAA family ATPase [Burkholderiaceae bacterium]
MSDTALSALRKDVLIVESQLNQIILGQQSVIRQCLICLLSRGHVLLEGDVGVGKTTLLRALALALGGGFSRIEGSIDMTPADLIYHTYISDQGRPQVEPGPLLSHQDSLSVFFFNEINRARPQVQALLLRAMAERSITAFNRDHQLPFMTAFADRNRVEKGETFELAAATRDRFMMELKVEVPADEASRLALLLDPAYHDVDQLLSTVPAGKLPYRVIAELAPVIQKRVTASEAIGRYALNLMQATRDPAAAGIHLDGLDSGDLVEAGASPRGMSLMLRAARARAFLEQREFLVPEDIRAVFADAISHRIFFNPVVEFQRRSLAKEFVDAVLKTVAAP